MLSVSIRKRLDNFTLDVSFETERETLALLGASGCGKSLTLKCIAGIEKPDEGRIVLNGRVLFDSEQKINLPPRERRVGYLFQQYALFPNMTVAQNIAAGVKSKSRTETAEAVREKISAFHLTGLEQRLPARLSGGEQQRVALARIFVNQPELLLLDEPFSALDDYLKWQLELELMNTLGSFGGPVVFVSHNRDEAYRLCGSVCVLSGGKSEPHRTVSALFESPGTMPACLISGCNNFSRVRGVSGNRLYASDWGSELHAAKPVPPDTRFVGVRAHYISPAGPKKGENIIRCEVLRVIDNVFSTVVMLKTPGGSDGYSLIRMEHDKNTPSVPDGAKNLNIYISPEDIMLLT